MPPQDLWRLSAYQVLPLLKSGEVKVETYARSLLERIQQRDAQVKAWAWISPSQVLASAKKLDELPAEARGPLFGLPVGVKDIVLTQDMPTQWNSRLYESEQAIGLDANAVITLRAAGALLLGKTSTTEFAISNQGDWLHNRTMNPHDPGRTPGGSSAGSGAAVGDFQVPVAIGTQTAGSIVRPAAFNGCYGWKPTWGAISREGMGVVSQTLDTAGFLARSVEDLELIADVFQIQDDEPPPAENFSIRGARIGFCTGPYWPNAGPGTRGAMDKARQILRDQGATVDEVELAADFDRILDWHKAVMQGESRTTFLGQYSLDKSLLHDLIVGFVDNRGKISRKAQLDAYDNGARLRPLWDAIASEYDVVITPSTVDEAPIGLETTGDMNFCSMWTMLHCPALNIPGFAGPHGLPVGLTAVAPRYKDRHLLRVSRELGKVFENEGGWQRRNA